MSEKDKSFNDVLNKIENIKKISTDPKGLVDVLYSKPFSNDINKKLTNSVSSLKNEVVKNKVPGNNVFNNMVKLANSFLDNPGINVTEGINNEQKLLRYIQLSAIETIKQSKQVINDEVNILFNNGSTDLCLNTQELSNSQVYELSPKEFDLMNVLKTSPESSGGKIMYESEDISEKIKFNKELYNTFNNGTYTFKSVDNTDLFEMTWNSNKQVYNVKTIPSLIEVKNFFDKYYETIEYPDIDYVIKTAMILILQGDGTEGIEFNNGLNNIERMLNKILQYCNLLNTESKPLKHNPIDSFDDNDDDIDSFFDFNNIEGIDIDNEDSRYRRVLKFRDCNNFEIPVNKNHIEDFIYKKDLTINSILDTFSQMSNEIGDTDDEIYKKSLFNSFILKIPISLLSILMSPKIFFPIVLVYKMIQNITISDVTNDVKSLLLKLKTFLLTIFGKLFKIFVLSFWKLLKKDIMKWISKISITILTNKLKRYKYMVSSLISLLTKLLEVNVNNCGDIYKLINSTIDSSLNLPNKIPLPGLLLSISDLLPGYSSDRAFMNSVQKMNEMGIETGTLYGESNDLMDAIKSTIDGLTKEIDENSYISVSNKELILPFGVIPPGILNCSGKFL